MTVNFLPTFQIALVQFGQQCCEWRRFEFVAERGIRGRRFSEAFEVGFEIQAGSAAENRRLAAQNNFRHCRLCVADELRGVKRGA